MSTITATARIVNDREQVRKNYGAASMAEESVGSVNPKPHSSSQLRSNSAPRRSSSQIERTLSTPIQSSSRNQIGSTPSPSSSEEQNQALTYEDAVKKLNELSPKSKGILKSIMKTMTNNGLVETNNEIKEKSQSSRTTSNNNTNLNKNSIENREAEKMATVNFANEPIIREEKSNPLPSGSSKKTAVSSNPELMAKPKRNSQSSNRVVTLNVGGHIFQTTSKTLRGCDSLFSLVFSEKDTVLRDENGIVFLDRDPKHFRYILNYLRDGKLVGKWNELKSDLLEKITHEAMYFQLPGIINEIEECRVQQASFDPRTLEEECLLRFYNQEVVKKSESGSLFACLDYHFNKQLVQCCTDPFRYFVKFLLRYGESSNLAIGVTCKQTNRWNRFEVLKKIKEKDTIAIWYNFQTEHLVLYWNDVEVQRKTFKINTHDWVFHVEMFADDNFCGLKLVQHQGLHPSQIEDQDDEEEESVDA